MKKKTTKKKKTPSRRTVRPAPKGVSVKALHRAIKGLQPKFVAAQRAKPHVTSIGDILTLMKDLLDATGCQKTMIYPIE